MAPLKVVWLCKIPVPNQRIANEHPASWIMNLLTPLSKYKNLEISIISYSTRIKNDIYYENETIKYYFLKTGLPLVNRGYPNFLPLDLIFKFRKLRKKVKKIINEIKPDLVHVHGTETGFAFISMYIPYLKMLSMQGVLTEVTKHENNLKMKLLARFERKVIKNLENFSCRTHFDKDFVLNIKLANVIRLEEAINPVFFQTKWEFNKNKILVYIGGIIDRKGIFTLIETLYKVNKSGEKYFLKIIGGGSKRNIKRMYNIISKNNLNQSVEYLGILKPEQISSILSISNLFVCPSKIENSPNSVCEAMAVGIPVIAFNVGGVSSLINHTVDGFLVANYSENDLTKCILNVNSLSQTQLLKISECAKERALLRNNPDIVAQTYYHEYFRLIRQPSLY